MPRRPSYGTRGTKTELGGARVGGGGRFTEKEGYTRFKPKKRGVLMRCKKKN